MLALDGYLFARGEELVAVVGGNEVVNPFNVIEVYVKVDGAWKLAALSFTRLLTPQ